MSESRLVELRERLSVPRPQPGIKRHGRFLIDDRPVEIELTSQGYRRWKCAGCARLVRHLYLPELQCRQCLRLTHGTRSNRVARNPAVTVAQIVKLRRELHQPEEPLSPITRPRVVGAIMAARFAKLRHLEVQYASCVERFAEQAERRLQPHPMQGKARISPTDRQALDAYLAAAQESPINSPLSDQRRAELLEPLERLASGLRRLAKGRARLLGH